MPPLPSLDTLAHLDPARSPDEMVGAGFVLAMTLSLGEADQIAGRTEPHIAWGVGHHPRKLQAQEDFNIDRFGALAEQSTLIGEVGLYIGSRVPLEQQLRTFRQVLVVAAELPRLVSIHSYRATGLVLEELRRQPIAAAVLHWWTGNAAETRQAVARGCYFSVHSALDDLILIPLGITLALKTIPAQVMSDARSQASEKLKQGKPVSWAGAVIIITVWLITLAAIICSILRILGK